MKFPPIGGTTTSGYGVPVPPSTPGIEQLYDSSEVKQLPGKGPNGEGRFVNWGTKLYQLKLELSYKNNEIDVLNKKVKKLSDELYPDGVTSRKSVILGLRRQNEVIQKKLQTKERQLQMEQKRCRGLEHDLSAVKKENVQLRKRNRVNDKAIQTLPSNHEATQISRPIPKKTKTIMTQCTPTTLKVTNSSRVMPEATMKSGSPAVQRKVYRKATEPHSSAHSSLTSFVSPHSSLTNITTKITPRPPEESVTVENKVKVEVVPDSMSRTKSPEETTSVVIHQGHGSTVLPSKPGVKFASSMTIKESEESAREIKDPLEMSIVQEFSEENSVKTVVKSNRDFEIKQKPVIVSNNGQAITGIEHVSRPECLKPYRSIEGDSGLGSSYSTSDYGSASPRFRTNSTTTYSPHTGRLSFKQILDGVNLSAQEYEDEKSTERVFERSVPDYMHATYYPPGTPSDKKIPQFNKTAWEIYNRGSVRSNPTGVIPYYLFRRTHENVAKSKTAEKPIFVHVSEIMMHH